MVKSKSGQLGQAKQDQSDCGSIRGPVLSPWQVVVCERVGLPLPGSLPWPVALPSLWQACLLPWAEGGRHSLAVRGTLSFGVAGPA